MKPLVKATHEQYLKAIELYHQGGANAVHYFANQEGITSWNYCEGCNDETPDSKYNCCLVCGLARRPS